MYTIRQVAELTGFSPDTLRYYEKIGLVQSPKRGSGGVRQYNEDHVHYVSALQCLKQTGLSLEEIKAFIQDGECIQGSALTLGAVELETISSRSRILAGHLSRMEKQRRELDSLIASTKQKLDYYDKILEKERLL